MTTYDVILRGEQCTTNARSKRGRKRLKDRFLFFYFQFCCAPRAKDLKAPLLPITKKTQLLNTIGYKFRQSEGGWAQ